MHEVRIVLVREDQWAHYYWVIKCDTCGHWIHITRMYDLALTLAESHRKYDIFG